MKLLIPVLLAPLFVPAQLPPAPQENSPEGVALLRAHYAAAEAQLRSQDTSALTPAQRAERERLLDVLAQYRERGVFGVNRDYPGARTPYFVDAGARRCAVAELMHASGADELVGTVEQGSNHAWIADLARDPSFLAWLERSGLTLSEAARIQAPPHGLTPGSAQGGGWGGGPTTELINGGVPREQPVDAPSGPSTPSAPSTAGSSGPARTGNSTPGSAAGAPTGSGPGSLSGGRPSTPSLALELDDGWWLWWEYNKAEFVRPQRLGMWRIAATGDDAAEAWSRFLANTRSELSVSLAPALSDPDAGVRRAAVDAIGKLAGDAGVPQLVRMLGDQSLEVRHHAILALGASGSADALPRLLAILREGRVQEGSERISSIAPAVAIVALGLSRRAGLDEDLERPVIERVRSRSKAERESIGCAAMLYQRLAPSEGLEQLALELASDHDEAPSVRCRAIEALTSARDAEVLGKLQHHLSGARLDERRSAALALGTFHDTLALPALQTAYELESEPLTRGFVLISIGRRGGPEARAFLLRTLAQAEGGDRHWAALALGLLGRTDGELSIRAAIRAGLKREKDRSALGAYWLALGLARDLEGRGILREALASGVDARQRTYAATALALIGDPESALLVREQLRSEQNPLLRVSYASALSQFGQERDDAGMVQVLDELKDPSLQGLAASALAFHGTRDALGGLRRMASDPQGSSVRRAAAIEGLSMMLGHTAPYSFSEVSRQANYTVFSDWLKGMLQVSL